MDGAVARRFGWLVAFATSACAPAIEEPLARLATCGEDGPVRVLEHGPDRGSTAQQFGDELLVRVYAFNWAEEDADPAETWVVGGCGESPRLVARDLEVHPWHDEHLVACDAYEWLTPHGDIVRIDPTGVAEPVALFEDVGCSILATEHGWLASNIESGELWIRRDPTSTQRGAELLADDLELMVGSCSIGFHGCDTSLVTVGDSVYYVNVEHQLTELSLVTGERSVLEENADWAWLSPTATKLYWKERGEGDDGDGPAPVHVRDMTTGSDTVLYEGDMLWGEFPYALAEPADSDRMLVDVDDATIHPLPPKIDLVFSRPGVDGILHERDGSNMSYVWNDEDEAAIPLGPSAGGHICSRAWWTEGLDVLRKRSCEDAEGDLWSQPYDGGAPRIVADGVSGAWMHFDGRVAWSTWRRKVSESSYVGDLFVATGPGERLRLDSDASLTRFQYVGSDVLYRVSDGDRSGLWRSATE